MQRLVKKNWWGHGISYPHHWKSWWGRVPLSPPGSAPIRRGGTKKLLGGLIWASDWVPAGLSKRSATIGWRGAYKKNVWLYKPPIWPETALPDQEYVQPPLRNSPSGPRFLEHLANIGGAKHTFSPPLFSLGGLGPPKPPPVPPPLAPMSKCILM